MNNLINMQNKLDIIPVSKWNKHFEYPTVGAIRQWMFKNTKKFNELVVRTVGTRKYIKISAFQQWVEETNK